MDPSDAEQEKAAVVLQTRYRGHASRQKTKELRNAAEQEKAAVVLQTRYRGHASRQKTKELRNAVAVEAAEQEKAATILQARYRGFASRRNVAMSRRANEGVNHDRRTKTSVVGNDIRTSFGINEPHISDPTFPCSFNTDEFGQKEMESAVSIQCAFRRKCAQREVDQRRYHRKTRIERDRQNAILEQKRQEAIDLLKWDPYAPKGPPDPDLIWDREGSPGYIRRHSHHHHHHHHLHPTPHHLGDAGLQTNRRHSHHGAPGESHHKRSRPLSPTPRIHPAGPGVTPPGKKPAKFHYQHQSQNIHVHDEEKKARHLRRLHEQRMHFLQRLHKGLKTQASATSDEQKAATRIQAYIKARLAQRNCAIIRVIFSQARQLHLTRDSVIARKLIEESGGEFPVESRVKTIKRQILTNILHASKKVLSMTKFLEADKQRRSGKSMDRATMHRSMQKWWSALDKVSKGLTSDDADQGLIENRASSVKRQTITELQEAREDLIVNVVGPGDNGGTKTPFSRQKTIKASKDGLVIKFDLEGEPAQDFEAENLDGVGLIIVDVPPGLKKSNGGPVVRAGDRIHKVNGSEDPSEIRQFLEQSRLDPDFVCHVEVLPSTLEEARLCLEALESQKQTLADRASRDPWEAPWVDSMLTKLEKELDPTPEAETSSFVDEPPTEWKEDDAQPPERKSSKAKSQNLRLFKPATGPVPFWLQSPECYGVALRDAISELCADQVEDLFGSLTNELDTDEQIALEAILIIDEGAGTAGAGFRDGPQVWQCLLQAVQSEMEQSDSFMWQQIFWRMSRSALESKEAMLLPLSQQWSLFTVTKEWNNQLALVQEAIGWANQKLGEVLSFAASGNAALQLAKQADRCQVAFLHSQDIAAYEQLSRPATACSVLAVGGPAKALRSGAARTQGGGHAGNAGLKAIKAPVGQANFMRPRSGQPRSARSHPDGLLPFTNWKHDVFLATMLPQSRRRMR